MPSVTLHPDHGATATATLGAGLGPHLPVGTYSGTRYRSALRFSLPSWGGWESITKATLSFNISDHSHVGPKNSSIYVRRQNVGDLWTKAQGSQNCNSGYSGGNTTQWNDILPTSTDQATFSSGSTANARKSVVVTAQVVYYRTQGASKIIFVFDQVATDDYTELWSEEKGGAYEIDLVIDYETTPPVPPLPTVTVTPTRFMEFANGAPRLRVKWTPPAGQTHYRVEVVTPFTVLTDWVAGSESEFLATTWAPTNGTSYPIRVWVRTAAGENSDFKDFVPRWGVTVHRRDLLAVPTGWQSANVVATTPSGTSIKMEYGSNTSAAAAPTAWFDALSDVPPAQWVYYRAWLLPSASAGPTLDKVTITSTGGAVATIDKWTQTKGASVFAAPWAVDTAEYVYGSRSMRCSVTGAGPFYLYSNPILLRANRTYILSALMKSQGDSGAQVRLEDEAGVVLDSPSGTVDTPRLTATKMFYDPTEQDVYRYQTYPYTVGGADMTVYAVLRAGGVNGAKAWFDAIKVEESTVNTEWRSGSVGPSVVDSGGVQIDGVRGGVFRYKGSTGGARDLMAGGAKGLVLGGDSEITSPTVGVLSVNDVPLSAAGGAFPATKVPDQRFHRTDLDMEFFWDGSRWLSTALYEMGFSVSALAATDPGNLSRLPIPSFRGGTGIWVVALEVTGFHVTAGTALSASHKWDISIQTVGTGATVGLGTYSINSGASAVWRQGGIVTVGQLIGTDRVWWAMYLTKTGTPGNVYAYTTATYRIVAA